MAALALGIVALTIASRALGPADFGRYEFVMANFNLVLSVLTLQLPVAYFNWVSRKGHKENTDYASGFIFYFTLIVIVLFGVLIYGAVSLRVNDWIWPDISADYLWLALALSAAMFAYQLCSYLADGRALTVGLEKIRLLQNILKTSGIMVLFGWGVLTLDNYFIIQVIAVLIAVVLSAVWLSTRSAFGKDILRPWSFDQQVRSEFNGFAIQYAQPLFVMLLVGFCFTYFDRWFLQLIAGSSQQGYFSLSDRLGTLAIIFTAAMTPLLTREFAFAYEERNMARLGSLFERIKMFYFLAAVIGCFMSVQSAAIVEVIGGEKYQGAIIPLAIMAMYPIHQTFGQLSAALLTATGQTRLYAKLAIIFIFASAPASYFLLASNDYLIPGLALGATGLAIKLVLIQFIATNVQLYFNTRMLKVSFYKWMLFQVQVVAVLYSLAMLTVWLINEILDESLLIFNIFNIASSTSVALIKLGVGGLLYICMVGVLIVYAPHLANLQKGELVGMLRRQLSN